MYPEFASSMRFMYPVGSRPCRWVCFETRAAREGSAEFLFLEAAEA